MTGELALQTHGVPARKLHIKHSSNGPVTIIHDVVEVRRILYEYVLSSLAILGKM